MSASKSIFICQNTKCLQLQNTNSTNLNKIVNTEIEFKKQMMCHRCGTSWIVCILCNKRFTFKQMHPTKNHFTICHSIPPPPDFQPYISTMRKTQFLEKKLTVDCNSDTFTMSFEDNVACNILPHKRIVPNNGIAKTNHVSDADMSDSDKAFFASEIIAPKHGFQSLVSKSVLNFSGASLSKDETLYHLDVAKFCSELNGSQQAHFARIMKQTYNRDIFTSTRPPNSLHDIHAFYTRSKHSIFNALPSPHIYTTEHHTYITLTSIIDYFLAYGHVPDYITKMMI